jgi:hypothetical protein
MAISSHSAGNFRDVTPEGRQTEVETNQETAVTIEYPISVNGFRLPVPRR